MHRIRGMLLLAAALVSPAQARQLTFEERVAAQEAVERVYHSHQIGARSSFEAEVPRSVLEDRVRGYLARSAALEKFWATPVTAEMLERELQRIARGTHLPGRLAQIYEALGNDAVLIQECFARPALVDRLARNFFADEGRDRDAVPEASWDLWWAGALEQLAWRDVKTTASPSIVLPSAESAQAYCTPDDTWSPTSATALLGRSGHTAVWTGNQMIVWGGSRDGFNVNTGARYNPLTDSWTSTSMVGVPAARNGHTALWTGSRMLVWGGHFWQDTGGLYDPITDSWTSTSLSGAPTGRHGHRAVWTGREMIVWGGQEEPGWRTNAGGRYNPVTDSWLPTTTVGAASARDGHSAVWTGDEMVIWGGYDGASLQNTGARYDPVTDAWTPTGLAGAPSLRRGHTAIWTGDEMLIWGGRKPTGAKLNTGGRYNAANDSWGPMALSGAPSARETHRTVWTGSHMIVWGGYDVWADPWFNTGGRFDPVGNSWTPTSTTPAPSGRVGHTMVWTGAHAIVWSGWTQSGVATSTGGLYALEQLDDQDGDGFSLCTGDCGPYDPGTFPGATEVCDGRDNDCNGLVPADEVDGDMDGAPLCNDCDDTDRNSYPGALESCDNADNDCDGSVDGFDTACGVGECAATGACIAGVDTCAPGTPMTEICDLLDNDCDGTLPVDEIDSDADGWVACFGDCQPLDATVYPGALEVNDGVDQQCPGDVGFGITDELSGEAGFPSPDVDQFCWPTQSGAVLYGALRSAEPFGAASCLGFETDTSCWVDPARPTEGQVFYYLARALTTNLGSWGQTSVPVERAVSCAAEASCSNGLDDDLDGLVDCQDFADCFGVDGCAASFFFTDGSGDDLAQDALEAFLAAVSPAATDYIRFTVFNQTPTVREWCAERADFYRNAYLANAAAGGSVASGTWNRWYRAEIGGWSGPLTDALDNRFGAACNGPYSWCSEDGLGSLELGIAPGDTGICEAFDGVDCGAIYPWQFTLTIGPDRLSTCGF